MYHTFYSTEVRSYTWGRCGLCILYTVEYRHPNTSPDSPNHWQDHISLSRTRRFMFVIFRFYRYTRWNMDPISSPYKTHNETSKSSPSPSYRPSSQWSCPPQTHTIQTLSGHLTRGVSCLSSTRVELVVRVWFVSIMYTLIVFCFFGSVRSCLLTVPLYISFFMYLLSQFHMMRTNLRMSHVSLFIIVLVWKRGVSYNNFWIVILQPIPELKLFIMNR